MNINICHELIQLLIANKLTLATCESASCGELASLIATVPGVSSVYQGGFITYTNSAKQKLLKIPAEIIDHHGAVSEETAKWMCVQTNKILNTDISISITGNAGPNPMEDKPIGLYFIGICIVDIPSVYKVELGDLGRDSNRTSVSIEAIRILYEHVKSIVNK